MTGDGLMRENLKNARKAAGMPHQQMAGKKEVRGMQTIKVKNTTTLADFSALFRAALYLSGREVEAEEGGFLFSVRENGANRTVKITEGGERNVGQGF